MAPEATRLGVVKEREVEFAEFETRIRKFILELMENTIHKASMLSLDLASVRDTVQKHGQQLNDMASLSVKAEQQISIVEHFREELGKWDVQRRASEAKDAEEISVVKQELDTFRYNLERKESALHGLQRSVDRVQGEMNRLQESQEALRRHCEKRLDQQSKAINGAKTDFEVKLLALETKHNNLSDELWGEETGLAKVTGELQKTNSIVTVLSEEMKKVQRSKANVQQLERMQEEVNELIREANSNVAALKQTVGNVVNDVKEHFRTATNTIASHNAAMISEVRGSYQEELSNAANLRSDVMKFMQDTQRNISHLEEVVSHSHEQTEQMVKEVRIDVEDLNRKRKRDKNTTDLEHKGLKKRLNGVFETSDVVARGLEHLSSVLWSILQSERAASALDHQDDLDRAKVALMGYKNNKPDEAPGSKGPARPSSVQGMNSEGQRSARGRGGHDEGDGTRGPVVSVDQRCLSCSGQAATVMAGFKVACLQYAPGPVMYQNRTFERKDLLGLRQQLLDQANEALQHGPMGSDHLNRASEGLPEALRGLDGNQPTTAWGSASQEDAIKPERSTDRPPSAKRQNTSGKLQPLGKAAPKGKA
jgi:chromosome segregation ATPase